MLRRGVIGMVLAIWSASAVAADPLTLILLRLLRDQILTAAAQAAYEGMQQPKPPAGLIVFPPHPYDLDDQKLRALIDEGFTISPRAARRGIRQRQAHSGGPEERRHALPHHRGTGIESLCRTPGARATQQSE